MVKGERIGYIGTSGSGSGEIDERSAPRWTVNEQVQLGSSCSPHQPVFLFLLQFQFSVDS